ncbi:MAG TPA: ABC transporter permease [Gemmataceae bacterium]|nr:ABC transporter permease [Gemmataceae bacterium]
MSATTTTEPTVWRAWCALVWLSFQRQARAHMMVWIALGLLGLTLLVISINTQAGRWTMAGWTYPRGKGPPIATYMDNVRNVGALPWSPPESALIAMADGAYRTAIEQSSGFFIFSGSVIFALYTTFLLPLWTISFATEGLGREREAQNLLWVLTRPIPRPAIFLAKYVALLPWCLGLNMGGFALICLAGGTPGRLALSLYWPAVLFATLAFSALFHMIAAWIRRAAIVALLYAFFIETIMGNMPGQFKRLSISFYTRCLMFERAHEVGIYPENPTWYNPVSGTTAWLLLATITIGCLIVGAVVFTRNEYLDVS